MKRTRPKPVPPLVNPAPAEHAVTPVSWNGAARSPHPLGASSDALGPESGDDRLETDRGGNP